MTLSSQHTKIKLENHQSNLVFYNVISVLLAADVECVLANSVRLQNEHKSKQTSANSGSAMHCSIATCLDKKQNALCSCFSLKGLVNNV